MSRKAKRRFAVYTSLLAGYLLIMTFGGCADRMILFPTTQPRDPRGATRLTVEQDGKTIEVWVARSPAVRGEPEAFVLEFTGNASRAEDVASHSAARWSNLPVEIWAMNYPGYGGSSGSASLSRIAPAAEKTFDALKAVAGDRPIFVEGNSIGTTAALHLGATRPVAGLVLQNSPPLRQMIWREHGWWNAWLLAGPVGLSIPAQLDSVANARRCTAPAIFVQSSADEVIPTKYQDLIINAYKAPRNVMTLRGADHNWTFNNSQTRDFSMHLAWLWVKGAGRPIPPSTPATTMPQ